MAKEVLRVHSLTLASAPCANADGAAAHCMTCTGLQDAQDLPADMLVGHAHG